MDPTKDEAQAGRPCGHHFFAYMYRLKHIERWSLMRNTTKENVAEHSFHVAMTTHMLCTIGNEVYGKALDTGRAVMMALFHDATEVFTGDIPTRSSTTIRAFWPTSARSSNWLRNGLSA